MAPLYFQYNFYFINMWFLDGVVQFYAVMKQANGFKNEMHPNGFADSIALRSFCIHWLNTNKLHALKGFSLMQNPPKSALQSCLPFLWTNGVVFFLLDAYRIVSGREVNEIKREEAASTKKNLKDKSSSVPSGNASMLSSVSRVLYKPDCLGSGFAKTSHFFLAYP